MPGLRVQRVVDTSLGSGSSPVAEFDSGAMRDRTHGTAVELGGLTASQPGEVSSGELSAAIPPPAAVGADRRGTVAVGFLADSVDGDPRTDPAGHPTSGGFRSGGIGFRG
jgi:hypothetical protein